MKRHQKIIVAVLLLVLVIGQFNCATIFDGTSGTRGKDIQWGYVVLDVLFTGVLGLIIDFADGAIYARVDGRTDIEQQMKNYAMKGKPVYVVRSNDCYKVELVGTDLKETKVAHDQIPANVWQAIEKQEAALQIAK